MRRIYALLFSLLFAVNSVIGMAVPILPVIKSETGFQLACGSHQQAFVKVIPSDKSYKSDYLIDDDQDDQDDNESDDEVYHPSGIKYYLKGYPEIESQHYFSQTSGVHYEGQPKKFILHCCLKIAC